MSVINIASCVRCSLGTHPQPNTRIVLGEGNPKAKVMLVGEAPGSSEAFMGRPFVGDAGKTLNELLYLAGINREDLYVTNICKCWPWKQETHERSGSSYITNRTPEKDEIKACMTYLRHEIEQVNPRIIIALGGTALSALEGRVCKITERMGTPSLYRASKDVKDRTYILPTLHPSYVMRNGGVKTAAGLTVVAKQVIEHLKYSQTMLNNPMLYTEHDYRLVDTLEKLDRLIAVVKERGVMSFDIETTGLKIDNDVLGLGIGLDTGCACYIPFLARPDLGDGLEDFWDARGIDPQVVVDRLKVIMEDPDIHKSAHNAKFDMRGLARRHGIDVKGMYWDTMCGSYIEDENAAHGLEDLANKDIDLLGYYDQWDAETNGGKNAEKASLPTTVNYCCGDCDATYRWTKRQIEKFATKPTFMWFMQEFYRPLVHIVKNMELYGVLYDVERAKAMSAEYKEKADKIKAELIKHAGCPFDPDSPQQVQRVLFAVLGLTHDKRTEKGDQATDKKVLLDLAKQHIVPRLILDYRHVCKMRSTYMEGFMSELDSENRLHISINPIGTVTGRLSSQGLMNIPREEGIKSLIIAPPGKKLVCADLSQAEVRCFAHYANEEVLRNAYENDKIDVHCMIAAEVMGMPYEVFKAEYDKEQVAKKPGKYSELRQSAKGTVFGLLYGRGPASIAMEYGMTFEQAVDFMNKFFTRFSNCKKWIDATHRLVEQTGEVVNIFGRIRRIPSIFSSDEFMRAEAKRQAVNSIIQATASDITNLALIGIDRELRTQQLPVQILFTVYDSIILEAPLDYVDPVKKLLKSTMERKPHPDFTVKIKADLDVYDRWGAKDKK